MTKKKNTNESKAVKQPDRKPKTSVNEKLGTTARSGKTGATGIIRDTGQNGMVDLKSAREQADGKPAKKSAMKTVKATSNGTPSPNGRKKLPVILITNDDGISAPGIRNLVDAVRGLGKIVVVAPDKPQSGMGHAITIGNPLRLHPMHHLFEGVEAWQCSGTPVDCVKLAVDKVLRRKPDLCLSGINHGSNHSINVIYSGTMSAAVEAAIESIPSVGFSLLDYSVEADFTAARKYVRIIVEEILAHPLDKHLILNVNFPAIPDSLIKGIKVCRQAYAKYEEDFLERHDPTGKKYYWLTGKFVNFDKGRDTDVWALEHNYVSVVPVQFDMTNYVLKGKLEKTWKS
ncbi:5'/3'-nucleotidase SurE [Flavitalea sp. BT771]|uniref:5'/3'-nucleotidase SurE n=1 Tax=Flavitalea sp. BT771 TaxID=3063329 RepID=UPI0026E1EA35|nr:5'/3'-nucleotidase SurE [Flavitalea sp. BT771]MDO6429435.1 5'/3'-nucleotidase SurE [Flavitalea sp. BT771]MDV6218437.1 5'/3'-nucleotidase SurE [Flavitalea sp. BT771]